MIVIRCVILLIGVLHASHSCASGRRLAAAFLFDDNLFYLSFLCLESGRTSSGLVEAILVNLLRLLESRGSGNFV